MDRVFGQALVGLLLAAVPGTTLLSAIEFEDITDAAGIEMDHIGQGQFVTGQVIADFNGDGHLDLFLTTSVTGNKLYVNDGDGTFSLSPHSPDVALAGLRNAGALALDYDVDGWTDLLVLGFGYYRLFRNLDGEGFEDVTQAAGLTYPGRGTGAASIDFNHDGYPDLFIANFSYTSPTLDGCDGNGHCDGSNRVYINNGDGTFDDVSEIVLGQPAPAHESFMGVWSDLDGDGRPDLYIVNDRLVGNRAYRNDGPGCGAWCFTDISSGSGLDVEAFSMGVAVGDYDRDLRPDVFVSDAFTQHLLRNVGTGGQLAFSRESAAAGVDAGVFGWGTLFADFDNDGWLDLYLNSESSSQKPDPPMCNRTFHNRGDGSFDDVSGTGGQLLCGPNYGLAAGDLDQDGRLDLVVGQYDRGYRILRNISDAGNFVQLKLRGSGDVPPSAAGSRVWLVDDSGGIQVTDVLNGVGLGGGSDTTVHFGLATANAEAAWVRWSNGTIEYFPSLPTNQRVARGYDGLIFQDSLEDRPAGVR